ncbi:unnamed protein product [Vitrella brassicaformis CCMP3155]|uniref:Spp2/MOS2 G-patch domain-containing protein n=2 Tax=Vitrella brassicaformis TaxID=1169539 RepID=A0A0G4FKM9_VITBC|nr:unnamed protein product [Vitrella brassicaformis CCMP3155]|eukprot:CEM14544.1 unnamed protein product [Vitrella brassicaformis CCMP3155]
MADSSRPKFSFSVKASKKPERPPPAPVQPPEAAAKDDRRVILSVDASGEFEDKDKAPVPGHLIIPCKNTLRPMPKRTAGGLAKQEPQERRDVVMVKSEFGEAADALVKEAKGEVSADDASLPVPILARNTHLAELRKAGLSEKDQLKREMAMLPEVRLGSYESVPIEQFGMAMLLGMGYDPKLHTTKPLELKKRAFDKAGLGANIGLPGENAPPAAKKVKVLGASEERFEASEDADQPPPAAEAVSEMEVVHGPALPPTASPSPSQDSNGVPTSRDGGIEGEGGEGRLATWLLKGLVVKIASQKHPNYREKGRVLSVWEEGGRVWTRVQLQGSGKKVDASEKQLETVVGRDCTTVKIVSQEDKRKIYMGRSAEVVERDSGRNLVVVRVRSPDGDGKVTLKLTFDEVCEYDD